MNMQTKILYGAGIIFAIGSFYRYFIMWPDLSQMVTWVGMGFGMIFVAWVYNNFDKIHKKIDHIDNLMEEILKDE